MGGQVSGRLDAKTAISSSRITLRVCADLGWRVIVYCDSCRHSCMLWPEKFAGGKLAGVPVYQLLERQTFKCTTRCARVPASGIEISCMDVGMSKMLARWKIVGGQHHATLVKDDSAL